MDSRHSQQQNGDGHLLPSTFSPWRGEGPAEPANNGDSTAEADAYAARPSVESTISDNTAQSLAPSDVSSSTMGPRGSAAFYSPQSLNVVPRTTIREPPSYSATPQNALSHSPSARSAQTVTSIDPSEMEGQPSLLSTPSGSAQSILAVSNVNAMRSASIMPAHPGAESVPMSAMYNPTPSQTTMVSDDEVNDHDDDARNYLPEHANQHSPSECHSRQDVYIQRWSWLYATLIFLSLYSTVFSGIWLGASILQPRYGRIVSTGAGWRVSPPTATLLATLFAKTIELSFVTVFVAVLGQVLTRRAFSRLSRGVTLAEMTMRNWVIQPGSLITHWNGIPYAATTFLGALTLSATICSLFYTTASDAMVSPKLSTSAWKMRDLHGPVKVSYANPYYIKNNCQTPLRDIDLVSGPEGCLDVSFSGQSYTSLTTYLAEWDEVRNKNNSTMNRLSDRPTGKHILYDNTTMDSSWIETENGDIAASFDAHKRIINNVTLAMPHAGVYAAATDPINGILQPSELLGVGEYSIRASVVSPVVNVLCVNMNVDELKPLVYTDWPNARKTQTGFPGQWIGAADWQLDVPATGWLNRTVVDDIFKWGEKYGRRPPAFQLYPFGYNMVTYFEDGGFPDAMYILAYPNQTLTDYTVCELRSWLTPKCSTSFELSGTLGGNMKARCEDLSDQNAYERTVPAGTDLTPVPSGDWRNVAREWQLALDFNGGVTTNNASNARILTSLFPNKPELNPLLPSMAEGIAVLATSTLVAGSINSTLQPQWTHYKEGGDRNIINETFYETFRAEVQTQQYASAHTASWQVIFYLVLILVFVLNLLCLLYLAFGTTLTSFSVAKSSLMAKARKKQHASPSLPFPISFKRSGKKSCNNTHSSRESDSNVNLVVNFANTTGNAGDQEGEKGFKAAKGLVTDYTEPQNLFALAINSAPSRALAGSCGHGPDTAELRVPWRVGYVADANHYFFEDNARGEAVEKEGGTNVNAMSSGSDLLGVNDENGPYGKSYKRLSSPWARL
ncbi:hypothetical protein F5Y01DRAFT_137005 [Xylaria sp. FL0043]|nr:hypothetical protein F5Y01DRAFT_137005 [Xylaria sp. FL0043]